MEHVTGRDDGFSLIEIATVLALVGILVSVAVASYAVSGSASRRVACLGNQRVVTQGVMLYRTVNKGRLPSDLDSLRPLVKWPGDRFGMCAAGGVAFEYDALTGDVRCPNHPR
jgi:prepilin-type N-terminal cleavage/methylation domain-containing protein